MYIELHIHIYRYIRFGRSLTPGRRLHFERCRCPRRSRDQSSLSLKADRRRPLVPRRTARHFASSRRQSRNWGLLSLGGCCVYDVRLAPTQQNWNERRRGIALHSRRRKWAWRSRTWTSSWLWAPPVASGRRCRGTGSDQQWRPTLQRCCRFRRLWEGEKKINAFISHFMFSSCGSKWSTDCRHKNATCWILAAIKCSESDRRLEWHPNKCDFFFSSPVFVLMAPLLEKSF